MTHADGSQPLDRDEQLRRTVLETAAEMTELPHPCGSLTITTVARDAGIAASTILDQVPMGESSSTPVDEFRRLVHLEVLDRIAPSPTETIRARAVSGLLAREPIAELASELMAIVVDSFLADPGARFLIGVEPHARIDPEVADAADRAWRRVVTPAIDPILLSAASQGYALPGFGPDGEAGATGDGVARLEDAMIMTAVVAYLASHCLFDQTLPDDGTGLARTFFQAWLDCLLAAGPDLTPATPSVSGAQISPPAHGVDARVGGEGPLGRAVASSDTLARAVAVGADRVLSWTEDEPVLPSATSICRRLGIGASTFQRLFGSAAEFRQVFLEWHLSQPFDELRTDTVELYDTGISDEIDRKWVENWALDMLEAVMSLMPELQPEVVYIPWHEQPPVARALMHEFQSSIGHHLALATPLLAELVPDDGSLGAAVRGAVSRIVITDYASGMLPKVRARRIWQCGDGRAAEARVLFPVLAGMDLLDQIFGW